jgi:predicted nucleic acid-binding protein
VVVSNTSPLNYLVQIDRVQILPSLYGRILIPEAVRRELEDARAPHRVREWISAMPDWIEVRRVAACADAGLNRLHPGEIEAILLAQSVSADVLLMDDVDGRKEAKRRSLRIAGTLAVLDAAADDGLIDFSEAMGLLTQTTFYTPSRLLQALLARDAARRERQNKPRGPA